MIENLKGIHEGVFPFFNFTLKNSMANTRLFSTSICAGLLVALCGEALANTGKDHQPILVEAFGFGIPEAGKSEAELRREAIEDALRNAEVQALVDVDMQVYVEDMRITECVTHLRSHGSAELSRILEADYESDATLPFYRVHVEALVHSPSINPPDSSVNTDIDQEYPKATLNVCSKSDPELGKSLQHTLAGYLQESGFHLVNAPTDPEIIVMNISLVQLTANSLIELQWKLEVRSTESVATDRIIGSRLVPHPEQSPMELQKLGALLVREAVRLTSP